LETEFHERRPEADDVALVGLVDRETGAFVPFGATSAFNLQQGSMMHWISVPGVVEGAGGCAADVPAVACSSCGCASCADEACEVVPEEFTYNLIQSGQLISKAVNPQTGSQRIIQGAIAAISPTAPVAVGLNYLRMAHCRPVVGYASNLPAESVADVPLDDGLMHLDLATGQADLLLSIADVIKASDFELAKGQRVWFNHVVHNPSGQRIMFFCRATRGLGFVSSLWTVNADGSNLQCQIPFGTKVSHFDWIDEERLLISTDVLGTMQFVAFTDGKQDFAPYGGGKVAAGKLPPDGHACFSPDGRWLLYDAFRNGPEYRHALLALYDTQTGDVIKLGEFQHALHFVGDIRCDLHPRWSSDGKCITFDSVHEGERQIYLVEL
jgi:hypothetical protein